MNFLFFLRNFTDRRTTHDFFFFPLSQDCSPFHLKEALYSFSLADQNCQNHFSCVLGPLLSKIRVTEQQHWGPMAVDLIVEMAANEWDVLDKEVIPIQGGTKQDIVRFNHITQVGLWGFCGCSDGKESVCNARDLGSVAGLGRSPGEGNGYPLQDSSLENSLDRGAWWATVNGVTKRWTQLSG